ncbi:MAG: hypothetical protein EPO26_08950 [Chloroflexota bacterium]|nr:MAG: hypothetical protein EPO26_08950 [Chloroflexota bacterium]
MEDSEASLRVSAIAIAETARVNVGVDRTLESLVRHHAHEATLHDVIALGPGQVPAARDRFVGVPVLLSPRGHWYVTRTHSHAALARVVLTEVGAVFDAGHPDRTLGADYGWVMAQAAGIEGLKLQLDRRPTHAQRAAIEDLTLYESMAGRPVTLHFGHPLIWSSDDLAWRPNTRHTVARGSEAVQVLLERVTVP